MTKNKDFEQMWNDTKDQIYKLSHEALSLLKKGEKEVVKTSGKAKVNFETMLLKLKKEQLYYLIGKESIKRGSNTKVDRLVKQIKEIDSQIAANNKLIKKLK